MTLEAAMRQVVNPAFSEDGKLLPSWRPSFGKGMADWWAEACWVLDFGAGLGRVAREVLLATRTTHVVAYEPDGALRGWTLPYVACGPVEEAGAAPPKARDGHEALWRRLHLAALPFDFQGIAFDGALTVTVLQHFSAERRGEAAEVLARAVRPGGTLLTLERAKADDHGRTLDALLARDGPFAVVRRRRIGEGEWGMHEEVLWTRR